MVDFSFIYIYTLGLFKTFCVLVVGGLSFSLLRLFSFYLLCVFVLVFLGQNF